MSSYVYRVYRNLANYANSTFQKHYINIGEGTDYLRLPDSTRSFDRLCANYNFLSESLEAKIVEVSDESISEASNLIKEDSPVSLTGCSYRGPKIDGWVTKRHNETDFEYVIFHLGGKVKVKGLNVSTHRMPFGECAKIVSVEGCLLDSSLLGSDTEIEYVWSEILPDVTVEPGISNLFRMVKNSDKTINAVRFCIHKDGGVARLRLYAEAVNDLPEELPKKTNLLSAIHGAMVLFSSDTLGSTGSPSKLLLSDPGKSYKDAWTTVRCHNPFNVNFAIIKLAQPGPISHFEVDTSTLSFSIPQSVELFGLNDEELIITYKDDVRWRPITQKSILRSNRNNKIKSIDKERVISHVKINILPDGSIMRLKAIASIPRARTSPTSRNDVASRSEESTPEVEVVPERSIPERTVSLRSVPGRSVSEISVPTDIQRIITTTSTRFRGTKRLARLEEEGEVEGESGSSRRVSPRKATNTQGKKRGRRSLPRKD